MFQDSSIAASYRQSYTKVSYILKFSIADHLKKQFITFKFDETTTIKTKKKYNGYLQYCSSSHEEIVNSYCGSIFIGHCCSLYDLVQHHHEFENAMELDTTFLLHLGMDGLNVNKKFASVLILQIEEETNSKVLACFTQFTLHFKKGWKSLILILMSFSMTCIFFFKLTSARHGDYASELTNVVAKYTMKHTSTRSISMKYVCICLLEQLPNLKGYFLKIFP